MIELPAALVPVEIKATTNPGLKDITGLRAFLDEYGARVPHGVLLHAGDRTMKMADRIWAVPLAALLR